MLVPARAIGSGFVRLATFSALQLFCFAQGGGAQASSVNACGTDPGQQPPSPVPTSLSGYVAASSSLSEAIGVTDTERCAYTQCFNGIMHTWSDWVFGTMEEMTPTSVSANSTAIPAAISTSILSDSNSSAIGLIHRRDAAGEFPFSAQAQSCCGNCQIFVSEVQILWWPAATSSGDQSTVSTLVIDGSTLISPSLYLAYTSPYGGNGCGYWGSTITSGIIPIPQSDLSRMITPTSWHNAPAFWSGGVTVMVTPTDLAGCESATRGEFTFTQTVDGTVARGDKCFPTLVVPTQLIDLQPAWSGCSQGYIGAGDPPRALTVVNGINTPPSTPVSPASVPAQNTPTPTSTPSLLSPEHEQISTASPVLATPAPAPVTTVGSSSGEVVKASPLAAKPTAFAIGTESFTIVAAIGTNSNGAPHTIVGLAVGSTTITADGEAVTLSGTVISLGSSRLIVGTRTENFGQSNAGIGGMTSSIDIGNVIMSGLGQIGGTVAVSTATMVGISGAAAAGTTGAAQPTIAIGNGTRAFDCIWTSLLMTLITTAWICR